MSWEQWPFYPSSLTEMISPKKNGESDRFISLLVSGCSERLGRALTIVEPQINNKGEILFESDPDEPDKKIIKFRRIDQINPREHFTGFCDHLRNLPLQEDACCRWDNRIAQELIDSIIENKESTKKYIKGYPCRMNLIDQAGVIRFNNNPVAIIFSGQFFPSESDDQKKVHILIDELAEETGINNDGCIKLHNYADDLETREGYLDIYKEEIRVRGKVSEAKDQEVEFSVDSLFLREIKEIEHIASAQYQMHKRDLDNKFRFKIRNMWSSSPAESREEIINQSESILKRICEFCGNSYVALFISPSRYISYEGNPNIILPSVVCGIRESFQPNIMHINWKKTGLPLVSSGSNQLISGEESQVSIQRSSFNSIVKQEEVTAAIKSGLKGKDVDFFANASKIYHMSLSDAYRAVLIWGPFPHLSAEDLRNESQFMEDTSEFILIRTLSEVQLCDSKARTEAWEEVSALLSHYSRRAMTPVSTGVRIVSDYVGDGQIYSQQDAEGALESLQASAKFIAQAVRQPLYSFAAAAEAIYKFDSISLRTIIEECKAVYAPIALNKSISIQIEDSIDKLPSVEVDTSKTRDAIGYILDNAIKYSHQNKVIRIYGKSYGNLVRFTIEDYGLGIEEDELHLIFGRGFQGKRSRKAIYEEGEGMGLFHARLIFEAHSGKIWCGSRSGIRSEDSSKLEGYRVWFHVEIPEVQSEN